MVTAIVRDENSDFCTTVGPVTRTAGIQTPISKKRYFWLLAGTTTKPSGWQLQQILVYGQIFLLT